MLAHYLRLIVFGLGLLVGIQVPAFVDEYAQRVSAHQIEANRALAGFQETANTYFGGSIEALIAHHTASTDAAFKDEGRTVRALYDRAQLLNAEFTALKGPLVQRIFHVAFGSNREIFAETEAEYAYTVPLSPAAIVSGLVIACVFALLIDGLLASALYAMRPRHRHRSSRPVDSRL
jgi:hypothetical protein